MKSIKALEIRLKELEQSLIFANRVTGPTIEAKIKIIKWVLERESTD